MTERKEDRMSDVWEGRMWMKKKEVNYEEEEGGGKRVILWERGKESVCKKNKNKKNKKILE